MANNAERTTYVDVDGALKRVMGNKKLYKRLLMSFTGDTNHEKLKEALDGGSYTDAASAAHAIKGVCANLSINELYEKSKELEMFFKDLAANNPGADPTSSGAMKLFEEFNQVREISMMYVEQVMNEIE